MLTLLVLAAVGLPAQARPAFDAFEVATIKPSDPDSRAGRYVRMKGAHQFEAKNYTLRRLIGAAYNLGQQSISGGPSWGESDAYDIVAVTPNEPKPTLDDQMAMLRKLLAERFELTFHREQKELSIYVITVAKGRSKLKETTASPDNPPALTNTVFPERILLPARNTTIAQFASMMQRAVLDRPVVDQTGLTGRYDFDLEWTPDETQFGGTLPAAPPDAQTKPGLFAAMQEQLGLKLTATRGPVSVLVIDRVQRPSEN